MGPIYVAIGTWEFLENPGIFLIFWGIPEYSLLRMVLRDQKKVHNEAKVETMKDSRN